MTQDSVIALTVTNQRLTAQAPTLQRRLVDLVRRGLELPKRILSQIFPSRQAGRPFGILPGFDAEVEVSLKHIERRALTVHLYADTRTVLGETRLQATPSQVITLDDDGAGSTCISVSPIDSQITGQAELRVIAIDPEFPEEIAGSLQAVPLAQEGTGRLASALLMVMLVLGITMQIWFDAVPILAGMIVVALLFMAFNTGRFVNARFEARRLLPRRVRFRAAALVLLGLTLWVGLMIINVGDGDPYSMSCGANDCEWSDGLVDNLTSILACFLFSACICFAFAPAINPRALAGRLLIVCAVMPLILYDLTLVMKATGVLSASLVLKTFVLVGWLIGALGILFVQFRHRLGGWYGKLAALLAATSAFAIAYQGDQQSATLLGQHSVTLVGYVLLAVILRTTVLRIPGRQWLRVPLFILIFIALIVGPILLTDALPPPPDDFVYTIISIQIPAVVLVIMFLVEVEIWRWQRKPKSKTGAVEDKKAEQSE